MSSAKTQQLSNIADIRQELFAILDGMDYCLDWRPDADAWSCREALTHMLYTPPPGVPFLLGEIAAGKLTEYELWADQKYLGPEAQAWDMAQVREQLEGYFAALETAVNQATAETLATAVMVHQRNRHWDEPRTAQWLVERLFAGHWREHLGQLRELRQALGV